MNDKYKKLKQKYDDIGTQILNLYREQGCIRDLMELACTHDNLIKIDPDTFSCEFDIDEEEMKYKCSDCYRYFSKEDIEKIYKSK